MENEKSAYDRGMEIIKKGFYNRIYLAVTQEALKKEFSKSLHDKNLAAYALINWEIYGFYNKNLETIYKWSRCRTNGWYACEVYGFTFKIEKNLKGLWTCNYLMVEETTLREAKIRSAEYLWFEKEYALGCAERHTRYEKKPEPPQLKLVKCNT